MPLGVAVFLEEDGVGEAIGVLPLPLDSGVEVEVGALKVASEEVDEKEVVDSLDWEVDIVSGGARMDCKGWLRAGRGDFAMLW